MMGKQVMPILPFLPSRDQLTHVQVPAQAATTPIVATGQVPERV